jgi:RHS repeat-associated protein
MDFQAFGGEIASGVGQRTSGQGYNQTADLKQKYAQTEREESGLDGTWWRKLDSQSGRWTSPDPYHGSMDAGDPQSFNRYTYAGNQPTNFIDLSGLFMLTPKPDLKRLKG